MLALIQRVTRAQVTVAGKSVGQIGPGYLVFLGVIAGDTDADLDYLVKKVSALRLMPDANQKMNLSLTEANVEILVISQFTLAGNVARGNRPSFIAAADPKEAEKYYRRFITGLQAAGLKVKTGEFGAYMAVSLVNDGPTTLIIDSKKR